MRHPLHRDHRRTRSPWLLRAVGRSPGTARPHQIRPARRISAELHALADRTAKVSESFGWLAPRLDRFLSQRAPLAQADRQQAQELIAQLLDIVDAAIRNARLLTDDVLDLDPDLRIGSFVWTEDFADTADMIRDRLDQLATNEPARDPNQLDLY